MVIKTAATMIEYESEGKTTMIDDEMLEEIEGQMVKDSETVDKAWEGVNPSSLAAKRITLAVWEYQRMVAEPQATKDK